MALDHLTKTNASSVSQGAHVLSAEESECRLRAHSQRSGIVEVYVRIDSSPQPYYRLERQAVEDAQVFTPRRLTPAPEAVKGIGKDAYWFPAEESLLSTDDIHLFTVKVNWPLGSRSRRRALAVAIAHTYL